MDLDATHSTRRQQPAHWLHISLLGASVGLLLWIATPGAAIAQAEPPEARWDSMLWDQGLWAPVPEPSPGLLWGASCLTLAALRTRRRHQWRSCGAVLGALLLVAPGTSHAGQVAPLATFEGGTPALASEVNDNFTAVKDAVDDNASAIEALQSSGAGALAELSTLVGVPVSRIAIPEGAILPTLCSGDEGLVLALGGAEIGRVLGFMGEEAVSRPYRYVVAFRVLEGALDPASQVDQVARLEFGDLSGRVVEGRVTSFSLAGVDGDEAIYRATIESELTKLGQSSGFRSFEQMKVSEMVAFEFGDAGILGTIEDSGIVYDYEVRWDETPLNFVQRLLERDGMHYHHDENGDVVVGGGNDSFGPGITLSYLGHLVTTAGTPTFTSLEMRSALRPGEVTLRGWDYLDKQQVEGSATGIGGLGERVTYSPTTRTVELAQARAAGLLGRERSPAAIGTGTSTAPALRAGTIVGVMDLVGGRFNGNHLVTSVVHAALADEHAGCFRYANAFESIPETEAYQPPQTADTPNVPGVVSAVVTDNDDPEGLHRVKVKFPWDDDQTSIESDWARLSVPQGPTGPFLFPEIDDEVLVSFVNGNPRHPVVVGMLWNPVDDEIPDPICGRARSGQLDGVTSVANCVLVGVDWTIARSDEVTDFSGVNFTGAVLSDLSFADSDMTGANLTAADLRSANLNGVQLGGEALLNAANLTDASLLVADLTSAELVAAKLLRANLSGAHLGGANLVGADLTEARLIGADLVDGASLDTATLAKADLTSAVLTGARIRLANLSDSILADADLVGSDLSGAQLSRAVLVGADLSAAKLVRAIARQANFVTANLTGADLSESDLSNASFAGANLLGADLSGAILSGVVWAGAQCPDGSSANFPDGDGFTCLTNL